jgi:hypothetical protein
MSPRCRRAAGLRSQRLADRDVDLRRAVVFLALEVDLRRAGAFLALEVALRRAGAFLALEVDLRRAVAFFALERPDAFRPPARVARRVEVELATRFCSRSRSRCRVVPSLPLSRRASLMNF